MDHSYIIDNTVLYCPVVQNHKSSKAHKKYFYIDSHRSDMKAKGNSSETYWSKIMEKKV